jgi:hypothetical protein
MHLRSVAVLLAILDGGRSQYAGDVCQSGGRSGHSGVPSSTRDRVAQGRDPSIELINLDAVSRDLHDELRLINRNGYSNCNQKEIENG